MVNVAELPAKSLLCSRTSDTNMMMAIMFSLETRIDTVQMSWLLES